MSEHLTREQIAELAEAVKNRESFTASGMHINYGESHDYTAGWNAGYDDNQACEAYDAECVARMAPELEPPSRLHPGLQRRVEALQRGRDR